MKEAVQPAKVIYSFGYESKARMECRAVELVPLCIEVMKLHQAMVGQKEEGVMHND